MTFSSKFKEGTIISKIDLNGYEQMAADLFLLDQCINNPGFEISIRFYTWEGNWLSLGKNQRDIPRRWEKLEKEGKIRILKRPSGGNAVLHSGGLTYSIIWKSPPRNKKESYLRASKWLIKGFSNLGIYLSMGSRDQNSEEKNCFSSATAADLIDEEGFKRIGSAQLWRKGNLLQHGEILISPNTNLWEEIFECKAPKFKPLIYTENELIKTLIESIQLCWPELKWNEISLTNYEKQEIKNNAKQIYV